MHRDYQNLVLKLYRLYKLLLITYIQNHHILVFLVLEPLYTRKNLNLDRSLTQTSKAYHTLATSWSFIRPSWNNAWKISQHHWSHCPTKRETSSSNHEPTNHHHKTPLPCEHWCYEPQTGEDTLESEKRYTPIPKTFITHFRVWCLLLKTQIKIGFVEN